MPRRWYWRWATSVLGHGGGQRRRDGDDRRDADGGQQRGGQRRAALAEHAAQEPDDGSDQHDLEPGHDSRGPRRRRCCPRPIFSRIHRLCLWSCSSCATPSPSSSTARSPPPRRPASSPSRRSRTPSATLERDLGVELFDRIGRRAQLTAAGEAFVPAAREVLRAVDTVRAEVGAVVDLITGRLDLVALPTLAVDPVAALVGTFRRRYPGVVVRLAHPDTQRRGRAAAADRPRRARHHRGAGGRGAHRHPPARPPGAGGRTPAGSRPARRLPLAALASRAARHPAGRHLHPRPPRPGLRRDRGHAARSPSRPTSGRRSCRSCWPVPASRSCPGRWPAWPVLRARCSRRSTRRCGANIGLIHRDAVLSPAASAFLGLATGTPSRG